MRGESVQDVHVRKWALRKISAGDWLGYSDDMRTLWRFTSYEDGAAHGLQVPYERRTFWQAAHMPMEDAEAFLLDDGALPAPFSSAWTVAGLGLTSRREAVALMEAAGS